MSELEVGDRVQTGRASQPSVKLLQSWKNKLKYSAADTIKPQYPFQNPFSVFFKIQIIF